MVNGIEENQITLEAVQTYLSENKDSDEVKAFTGSFVNGESVEAYLGSEDGMKLLQPRMDKHFSTSLETWKKNNLDGLIENAVNEKFPAETEEQKQIRKMQDELKAMKGEKAMAEIKNQAIKELNGKGLPVEVADLLTAGTIEETRERINLFGEHFTKAVSSGVDAEVKKRLGKASHEPLSSDLGNQDKGMTKADLLKMDYDKAVEFYHTNPEAYNRIMNS